MEDKAGGIDAGTIALEGEGGTTFHVEYVNIEGKGIPSSKAVTPMGKVATFWGALKR